MRHQSHIPPSVQQACEAVMYSWAQAQDTKDAARLLSVFAPIISTDYSSVGLPSDKDIPAQQHVDAILSPTLLGRQDVKTQHLVGAQTWSQISDRKVRCAFQIRVDMLRVTSETGGMPNGVEGPRAVPHGWNEMVFEVVDEQWRIVFLGIHLQWLDGAWNTVFNDTDAKDVSA